MDPFDDLLRGIRADGAAFSRQELSPPWALRFAEAGETELTLATPLRGEGWICSEEGGGEPRPLRTGDALIVRGPQPRLLADRPAARSGGPAPLPVTGRTTLFVGTYRVRGAVSRQLFGVLPPLMVMSGDGCPAVLDLLDALAGGVPPERQVVQDRLLDWLLVCTLRGWFDQPDGPPTGWLGALTDDTVGPALRAMHDAPERPWTLAALATASGVSRTTLAQRFTRLVGRPPLTYLTDWRMALAADLLTESTATLAAVARQVGYADAFGFSAAFKRVHGVSPSAYRDNGGTRTGALRAETGGAPDHAGPGLLPAGSAISGSTRHQ
ncbi:AraC family transcriptional regulator [Streptomyces clavuligerus]|nr:AraC family transcriptional regulator [Streptomyces clavuligerus]ANW22325.1 cupin [Streptomyces clavuligerus]AXU17222.1 AraC family transcriptional regulator [Streptomyces clavuligerus]EDY47440.1 helix-turn-helix domain-containing protein [Streptomyces clavuligerus]MBY6307132.1 AraC family transcriptional regulator [Streptomyces clavuligerus]QCS10290.1 AraC family transcriptional regulator [Streptomyces clavuligerus]